MPITADAARLGPISVMGVTEHDVVEGVRRGWLTGRGGSIVTVNVDILRAASRDAAQARLVECAELVVADGMPIVWAARMAGAAVPERVTGAALVFSLSEAAAQAGRTLYLIGGLPGVPEAAARALAERYPGLRVVGADSPPFGFEHDEGEVAALQARVAAAAPDLVMVGLGFPKQEQLIARLRPVAPAAWFLGCGAGIPMAAGQFDRAPELAQRMGAEWAHRLIQEPRRLARRYLVEDLPFALALLTRTLARRVGTGIAAAVRPAWAAGPAALPAGSAPLPVDITALTSAPLILPLVPVPVADQPVGADAAVIMAGNFTVPAVALPAPTSAAG